MLGRGGRLTLTRWTGLGAACVEGALMTDIHCCSTWEVILQIFCMTDYSLIRPWVIKFLVFFPKEFSVFCIEGTMSLMVVFTQDFSLIADQSADFQYFVMKTPSFFIRSHRRNISLKILISGFEWHQISRVCVTSNQEIKLRELCTALFQMKIYFK